MSEVPAPDVDLVQPSPSAPAEIGVSPAEAVTLEAVLCEVVAVRALVDDRLRYDATKEEAFRRLYDDLQRAEALAALEDTREVLFDVVLLADRLSGDEARTPAEAGELLASLREETLEILARRGVFPMADAETFDARLHRAAGVVPTEDAAEDRSIERVLRRGYERAGQVVRPQEVVVRKYSGQGGQQ